MSEPKDMLREHSGCFSRGMGRARKERTSQLILCVASLLRNGAEIFHTYFTDGRGVEHLGSVWTFLDLTPYGRQEDWEDSPKGWPQTPPYTWWRYHDEY